MGYFVAGSPKTYLHPAHPHSVRQILLHPTDPYLLNLTSHQIYIWNAANHRVLIARYVLPNSTVAHEGPFVQAAWQNDTIIVALTNGLLLILRLVKSQTNLLTFDTPLVQPHNLHPISIQRVAQLRVAHANATVTALVSCPVGALVATSASTITCIAWHGDMLWRTHIPQLLRHNDAISKMGVFINALPAEQPLFEAIRNDTDDNLGGITAMAYDHQLGFCAIVLGNGHAFLLALHSAGYTRPSAIDGRWLRSMDAVSIALEPRRMLATVGLSNGDVDQYYVGVPAGDRCPLMRTLSLSNWYFEPTDVGAAVVVRWTQDGSALLVGWEKRGLAVWSVSGCRLMWTLPPVGGTVPTTPAMRKERQAIVHPMEQGVLSACWGPQGLYLWAAPRVTEQSPKSVKECHFMEFTLFKGTVGATFVQNDSSRLALFGADRILMLWHAEDAPTSTYSHVVSSDLFSWQHLIIPHEYLWRNWPPKRVAINSDASYAAVAGEHGVAICQVRFQRWKVFGDLAHDRRIRCCALAWIGRTIVIANELVNASNTSYELLFYPRDQIEASALQAQRSIPSKPLITDVRPDGYLLVMCEDAQVFLYKVTENYSRSRIDLREVYRLFLPTRGTTPMYQQDKSPSTAPLRKHMANLPPPAPGGGISEARIFPPLSHARKDANSEAPVPTHIMLLRTTGSLILLDTERMVSTALLRYVERFWYTPENCTPFHMVSHRPVWWAYGDDGIHVCFQDGISKKDNAIEDDDDPRNQLSPSTRMFANRKKAIEVEQWFELDPEVYPLSIMSRYGMLLGATQGLMTQAVDMESGSSPCHVIKVKRQPILHTLLRHLLMKPMSDERTALQVALKCVSQPQFVDSLEWLLYEAVLEHEDDVHVLLNGVSIKAATINSEEHRERQPKSAARLAATQGFPESPRRKKAGSDLFPRVIRLLKYFGEYEDVVVRCARKLDSKRWPLLFSLAGEPAALLEQCFVSGRLRTAACLLVILQEMWGFISSTPHSLRLVEAALDKGELGLAADLANFLTKAHRGGMLNSSQLRTTEDVSWIADAARSQKDDGFEKVSAKRSPRDDPADRIPPVDLAVLNHARSLLNSMQLRDLAALSVRMDFPLAEWLRRELKGKNASRPCVRDFGTTILSLHRQFQFAEPTNQDVRKAMRTFNYEVDIAKGKGMGSQGLSRVSSGILNGPVTPRIDDDRLADISPRAFAANANNDLVGPGADTVFGSQLPPPPSSYDSEILVGIRGKGRELCIRELTYLMTVGRVARTPDVMLCCATLLLDISVLRMVLRGYEDLFEPYMAALSEFNVSGYDALVAVLNEIAAPK